MEVDPPGDSSDELQDSTDAEIIDHENDRTLSGNKRRLPKVCYATQWPRSVIC